MSLRTAILAYSPAPYRVELFNQVATDGDLDLRAIYLHRREPGRKWKESPIHHSAIFLSDGGDAMQRAEKEVNDAALTVISHFSNPSLMSLWRQRVHTKKRWTFWGERPGAHRRGWVAMLARRFRMRLLHASLAPIWAIGSWALDAYQKEFGPGHAYASLPYYSDLERFECPRFESRQRILFSGSLIPRKGVDLLQSAFDEVKPRFPNATLTLAGPPAQFVDWAELPSLYSRHDILAVPSRYDGWGMVVPEGLASGMPVIGTDQMGAAREFIVPGKNGWLATAGDLQSLTDCLEKALSITQERYLAMSAAACESVRHHQLRDGARRLAGLCHAAMT